MPTPGPYPGRVGGRGRYCLVVLMRGCFVLITTGPPASQGLLCDFSAVVSCNLRAVDVVKTAALESFETLCT